MCIHEKISFILKFVIVRRGTKQLLNCNGLTRSFRFTGKVIRPKQVIYFCNFFSARTSTKIMQSAERTRQRDEVPHQDGRSHALQPRPPQE